MVQTRQQLNGGLVETAEAAQGFAVRHLGRLQHSLNTFQSRDRRLSPTLSRFGLVIPFACSRSVKATPKRREMASQGVPIERYTAIRRSILPPALCRVTQQDSQATLEISGSLFVVLRTINWLIILILISIYLEAQPVSHLGILRNLSGLISGALTRRQLGEIPRNTKLRQQSNPQPGCRC